MTLQLHNNLPEVGRAYRNAYRAGLKERNKWLRNKINEMEEVLEEHDCYAPVGTDCICWSYRETLIEYKRELKYGERKF